MEMDVKSYYSSQSVFTDPGAKAELLADLPKDPAEIAKVLQGVMTPFDEIYKHFIQNERVRDTLCRYAEDILGRIVEIDKGSPLTEERPAEACFVANSSDYANLFVGIARSKGWSARKRTGFIPFDVGYNGEPYFRLHDIAEYRADGAWKRIDPSGMAKDVAEFIPAAKAWQDCRVGRAAPDKFRDEEHRDFGVLTAALLLDLAAMGKMELTIWDRYGWAAMPFADFKSAQWEKLDDLAIVLQKGDEAQEELVAIYNSETGLQVPHEIRCESPVVPPHQVELKF